MAPLYKLGRIPELSTRLLSVTHIFRDHPTTCAMKACHSKNVPNASHFRKCSFLQASQSYLSSRGFHTMCLCSKNIYFVQKCVVCSPHNIERNISSHQTYNSSLAQTDGYGNHDDRSKSSVKSKNSLVIEDDELFFDNFMQFVKKNEFSARPDIPIPLQKYYFSPTSKLTQRTPEEIQDYLKQHNISLNKADTPPPIKEFCDVEFPAAIMKLLEEQYQAPTAIQAMGWSLALTGNDVVGIGQTGSGKTLSYILPALLHTAHQQRVLADTDPSFSCHCPVAVVLTPSRDLATQVARVVRKYSAAMGVQVLLATGGVEKCKNLNVIKNSRPKFVVATPGRLMDLLLTKDLLLDYCSFLVLDEADRMLNMGFEAQLRCIMQIVRNERQTLLWSATWPSEVQQLASSIVSEDAVQLTVGSTELRANPDIEQRVHVCEFLEKTQLMKKLLREMLMRDPNSKALIFVNSFRDMTKVSHKLRRSGFSCNFLHGGLDQPLRDEVLKEFRKGQYNALIATDLASRGLDIEGLGCVINYDFPETLETYIHRIGRTGRCGQRGVAHTFFSQRNMAQAPKFVKLLRESGQEVCSKLAYMAAKSMFLPESQREIFLPFVPQRTSKGETRSESLMGGPDGTLLGPIDQNKVTPRQYALNRAKLLWQARLQSKLAKADKSKIVNTKYCIQKKR